MTTANTSIFNSNSEVNKFNSSFQELFLSIVNKEMSYKSFSCNQTKITKFWTMTNMNTTRILSKQLIKTTFISATSYIFSNDENFVFNSVADNESSTILMFLKYNLMAKKMNCRKKNA